MRESKATMASFSKATELLSDLSGTLVVSNELSLQKQYFPLVGTVTFAQFSLAHDLLDVGDEDPDLVCVDLVLSVPLLRLVTLVREEHREGQQGGVLETHSGALDQCLYSYNVHVPLSVSSLLASGQGVNHHISHTIHDYRPYLVTPLCKVQTRNQPGH